MHKVLSVILILGILLLGSTVVGADPGSLPGTEPTRTIVNYPDM